MDRYVLIVVDRATGEPTERGHYEGEAGADRAHARAAEESADGARAAFVVGLR